MKQDSKTQQTEASETPEPTGFRAKLVQITEGSVFTAFITTLICLNAITLGLESFDSLSAYRGIFMLFDLVFVIIFVLEMGIRVGAAGPAFFRSGWNTADFLIVISSAIATTNLLAALRAFRVLRLLRVITFVPRMRTVVRALVDAVPGIISVAIVAVLIIYVFAVIACALYGETHPHFFDNVFTAMYTLFQIITLEGWKEIADDVQAEHPYAWIYFLAFVLIGTFTMLNLFIAIVVRVVEEEADDTEEFIHEETDNVIKEIRLLSDKIDELEAKLVKQDSV